MWRLPPHAVNKSQNPNYVTLKTRAKNKVLQERKRDWVSQAESDIKDTKVKKNGTI